MNLTNKDIFYIRKTMTICRKKEWDLVNHKCFKIYDYFCNRITIKYNIKVFTLKDKIYLLHDNYNVISLDYL